MRYPHALAPLLLALLFFAPERGDAVVGGPLVPGPVGPVGPQGPAGASAGTLSLVDMAVFFPSAPVHVVPGAATSNGNTFWQTSSTATTAGGRLYWVYSGAGTDTITVKVWTSAIASIAHQTLSLTTTGLQTFAWIEGTVALSPYTVYGITMSSTSGTTAFQSGSLGSGSANVLGGNQTSVGNPPYTWGIVPAKNQFLNYIGVEYVGTGGPFGQGVGNLASCAPVEATVTP